MAFILCIETSTKRCSVALFSDSSILASKALEEEGYTHAENLHVFIREVLDQAGLHPSKLNAIAVSKGPGSYTGLRIGVSAAKGLAYALEIPLIAINTLELLAQQAREVNSEFEYYLPMIDARRMEVYTARFDRLGEMAGEVEAIIIDEQALSDISSSSVAFFGDGGAKCREVLEQRSWTYLDGLSPDASAMGVLVCEAFEAGKFEDVAYFEPFYLKDFIAGTPKKLL